MTVWVYVNLDYVRVFSTRQKANAWIKKHDSGGVAVECKVDDAAPLE
ncbi:MAG: hypothetical protein HC869_20620 [Rhodospirillales bacterium]|nr:hypothetical protein [Rhodospirillales bacterium]